MTTRPHPQYYSKLDADYNDIRNISVPYYRRNFNVEFCIFGCAVSNPQPQNKMEPCTLRPQAIFLSLCLVNGLSALGGVERNEWKRTININACHV